MKQAEELLKVYCGAKYTKNWNFWARLCANGVVNIIGKGRVESIQLTETALVWLRVKGYLREEK